MLIKETRECGLYASIALLCEIQFLGSSRGLPVISFLSLPWTAGIPVLAGPVEIFTSIAAFAGITLGLHQTMWESWRQTTLFLLHRPMPRQKIFLAKLVAGSMLIIGITAPPLLIYCLWAATPGMHASPFFWSFSEPYWRGILIAIVSYLGAFLVGLRTAYWIGSRAWPLIAVGCIAFYISLAQTPIWLAYIILLALISGMTVSIVDSASSSEYP